MPAEIELVDLQLLQPAAQRRTPVGITFSLQLRLDLRELARRKPDANRLAMALLTRLVGVSSVEVSSRTISSWKKRAPAARSSDPCAV